MKKNIIIILIFILLIAFFVILLININNNTNKNMEIQNSNAEENETKGNLIETTVVPTQVPTEAPSEITLYDKEDGYFTVELNKNANINKYNFEDNLKNENGLYKYEDEKFISKLGIDLSGYQEEIEWEKIKQAGIEFVILRLGFRGYGKTGKLVLDSKFEEHYNNATQSGMKVGVYFFSQAINDDEAKQEAEFVISNINDKKIELPIFFDLEKIKYDDGRANELSKEEITNVTHIFCNTIKENGYMPGIYGISKSYTTRLKLEEFNDIVKWHAEYLDRPLYPYEFEFWQYTETGAIDGIKGNVDINLWFVKK